MLPVNILTGFLGSGKTTLLRHILEAQEFGDSMVLVNEFGEVGLDHILIGEISPDVVLLNSGCLCCTLRGEVRDSLSEILSKRTRGEIPPFKRVIIETTGLAQPSLLLSTVFADPQIRHHYTVGAVATTVDSLNAKMQSTAQEEWSNQVAAADTVVLTKTDLVDDASEARDIVRAINPTARIISGADLEIANLFNNSAEQFSSDAAELKKSRFTTEEATAWMGADSATSAHGNVSTIRICTESPIDWEAFGVWLSMLLHAHGDRIMRVKGILNIAESEGPVVIQGVQYVIYPPEHLDAWGRIPKQTDLVFIVRGIETEAIERSFNAFVLKDKT